MPQWSTISSRVMASTGAQSDPGAARIQEGANPAATIPAAAPGRTTPPGGRPLTSPPPRLGEDGQLSNIQIPRQPRRPLRPERPRGSGPTPPPLPPASAAEHIRPEPAKTQKHLRFHLLPDDGPPRIHRAAGHGPHGWVLQCAPNAATSDRNYYSRRFRVGLSGIVRSTPSSGSSLSRFST